MPIYEYRCEACGERFERWFAGQDKASATEVHCPACDSPRVRRLISAARVRSGTTSGEDAGAEDTPAPSKLFGRKEIAEVTRQKQKMGLL